jgi:hypothetical protein
MATGGGSPPAPLLDGPFPPPPDEVPPLAPEPGSPVPPTAPAFPEPLGAPAAAPLPSSELLHAHPSGSIIGSATSDHRNPPTIVHRADDH